MKVTALLPTAAVFLSFASGAAVISPAILAVSGFIYRDQLQCEVSQSLAVVAVALTTLSLTLSCM